VLAAGSRYRRRCHRRAESSWQAMVSMKNFHRFAWACPPPADTPDGASARHNIAGHALNSGLCRVPGCAARDVNTSDAEADHSLEVP
jgi:hypothetical protein